MQKRMIVSEKNFFINRENSGAYTAYAPSTASAQSQAGLWRLPNRHPVGAQDWHPQRPPDAGGDARVVLPIRRSRDRPSKFHTDKTDDLPRRHWASFRRLIIRYERCADIQKAFLALGCTVICFQQIQRFC
jgi:hypothetical protein